MVAKAHLAQRVERAGAALCARDARQGERQFHVRQDGLVGDEIVGLEDEPDAVVTECVPVAILVFLGRDAVDDEVARVVVVEPADDVEQRRLPRTRRPEDRHELAVAEGDGHVVERGLGEAAGGIGFANIAKLEHLRCLSILVELLYCTYPARVRGSCFRIDTKGLVKTNETKYY